MFGSNQSLHRTESEIMEIQINSRNVPLTESQLESIEQRLQFAFGRYGSRIQTAKITLTDVDGPRRGTDVLCRLKLTLEDGREILLGDTELSVEAAVANVADRATKLIARTLDLHRDNTNTRMADTP